ncbi:MAG: hypothetical protein IJC97_02370 [Oscillospiraceae bacterium]|nr:hypothetical protein [Oscillospiraceae bacterium]
MEQETLEWSKRIILLKITKRPQDTKTIKINKKLTERIDFFGNMWYTLLVTRLVLVLLTIFGAGEGSCTFSFRSYSLSKI